MSAWVPCPDCESRGTVTYHVPIRLSKGQTEADLQYELRAESCPTCSGLGELPSEGMIEAAAKGMVSAFGGLPPVSEWDHSPEWWANRKREATAALVAARKWEKENG